jgi:hypothetical protein
VTVAFVNLLLIGFLNFLAPSKEPTYREHDQPGLTATLIDLAQLAKGRIFVCFVKEGMASEEVYGILGTSKVMISMGAGHNFTYYFDYGISVNFTPPFGIDAEKYNPRVIDVHWHLPQKYRWNRFWMFGKASNRKQEKLKSSSSSSDPNQRMHELINNSEDVREDEETWEKLWKNPKSKVERVRGGIQ